MIQAVIFYLPTLSQVLPHLGGQIVWIEFVRLSHCCCVEDNSPSVTRQVVLFQLWLAAKSQNWKENCPHLGLSLCHGHYSGFLLKDEDSEQDLQHHFLTPLVVQGLHSKQFLIVL